MKKPIKEVYPNFSEGDDVSDYIPMLNSFGFEKWLQVDDDDYQGDSWVLYRDGVKFGVLVFGWVLAPVVTRF